VSGLLSVGGLLVSAGVSDLTDRQSEVSDAAYRAGYFNWPRDSIAEEVADSPGIASATLHAHLRKAEETLPTDRFDDEPSLK